LSFGYVLSSFYDTTHCKRILDEIISELFKELTKKAGAKIRVAIYILD
jgi:hypothetical protein